MRKAAEVEVGETEAWGSACGGDTGLQVSRARRKKSVNAARWIGPAGFAAPHWLAHQRWLTAFVFRSNFVNLQWEGQPSRRTIQTSAEKKHWIQTKNSFSLSLSLNYFCCPTSAPFPFILCYFLFLFFCNCDSRSGFEVVLRLLVPGGSGDWSLCTGRRRSRSSDHTAGSKERSRQEDGATGGGTALAPGTSSPYLAHHGAAEQSASPRECNCEPGSEHSAYRGEWGKSVSSLVAVFCLV